MGAAAAGWWVVAGRLCSRPWWCRRWWFGAVAVVVVAAVAAGQGRAPAGVVVAVRTVTRAATCFDAQMTGCAWACRERHEWVVCNQHACQQLVSPGGVPSYCYHSPHRRSEYGLLHLGTSTARAREVYGAAVICGQLLHVGNVLLNSNTTYRGPGQSCRDACQHQAVSSHELGPTSNTPVQT